MFAWTLVRSRAAAQREIHKQNLAVTLSWKDIDWSKEAKVAGICGVEYQK